MSTTFPLRCISYFRVFLCFCFSGSDQCMTAPSALTPARSMMGVNGISKPSKDASSSNGLFRTW